jgi:hypothetical protein
VLWKTRALLPPVKRLTVQMLMGALNSGGMLKEMLEVGAPVRYDSGQMELAVPAVLFASDTPDSVAVRPEAKPLLSRHTLAAAL